MNNIEYFENNVLNKKPLKNKARELISKIQQDETHKYSLIDEVDNVKN